MKAATLKAYIRKQEVVKLKNLPGIDSPYEAPINPDLVVDTEKNNIETCVKQIVDYIETNVVVDEKNHKKDNVHVLK